MLYNIEYQMKETGELCTTRELTWENVQALLSSWNESLHVLVSVKQTAFPFEVGDEVSAISDDECRLIVTKTYEEENKFSGINLDGGVYSERPIDHWQKTGRHVDILKFINEEQ